MKKLLIFFVLFPAFLFSACSRPEETNIMSFNLRYSNGDDGDNSWIYRREACVRMLLTEQPDIVGVQEALPNMLRYLQANLPDYACEAVGRDPEAKSNEASGIFYRKDRYRLVRTHSFWLSETPDSCSIGWDAKYKRIATYVWLQDKQTGKELAVLNTHLDHKGVLAQEMSLQLVSDTLVRLQQSGVAVFAMGDFNVRPENPVLRPIRATMQSAQETATVTDMRPTFQGFGRSEDGEKIIDYIFYLGAEAQEFRVLIDDYGVAYLSDHNPLVATFKL